MARYSALVGLPVEVHYRAGDICIPAIGILVADSGRSVFLKRDYEFSGHIHNFSWEIPYSCIIRLRQEAANGTSQEAETAVAVPSGRRTMRAKAARASTVSSR